MKVRCGACRTEFDAETEGRHACPICGAINQVSAMPPPQQSPPQQSPPQQSPPPPVEPAKADLQPAAPPTEISTPLARVACDQCAFEFVVGDIEVATCPNCSAEVQM